MKYNCPVCQIEMREQLGNYHHPGDATYGIFLSCGNANCKAQEVAGHGDTVKDAWKVVQDKFVARVDRN